MSRLLLLLLQLQSLGRLVANLGGTEVLDGAGIYEACLASPLGTMLNELLEGSAVQLNQSLADNGLHLTVTLLHVHHHGDRYTTGNPLVGRSNGVLD